ncbi:hypothetical protein [Citricoccus nitrophenolicus]|uniref:hypothetical protein n=1 Tax=Citricoccus nitrophenolicus TaxID=863575 RepID=UPI0031E63F63
MSTVTSINKTEAPEQIILANPHGLTTSNTMHLALDTRNAEVLSILSHDDDVMVRENVATNLHIDAETIARLSTDEDEGVRNYTAANPATPAHILEAMRTDGITWDYYIAQNPNASAALLDSLASKHADKVTTDTAVASHPNTSVETLNRLAKGYEVTKVAVAKNPNATIETLFLMTVRKEDHDLQRAVVANMNASEVTLDNIARVTYLEDVQVAIAQHPTTHRKTLEYLAVKGTPEAREAVQERRATDAAHTQDVEVVAA